MPLYSTYSWSSDQAVTLVTLMKANYSGSVSTIPDGDLAYYSTFLIGLSPSDLSTLTITSLNTINALGLVSTWSNAQLTSLVSAIKANGNSVSSSSVLIQMKNLACGIPSSDWSTMTSSTVSDASSTLKTISNTECPTISNMFSALKPATLDSASLTDLDVISGGFGPNDLTSSGISSELLPFATLKYVSANTVNAMTSAYLNALTTEQINALVNSPYYSDFSSSIKTSLNSLSTGSTISTVSTSSSGKIATSGLCQISTIIVIAFYYFGGN
jgi:hypothetical protein